MRKLRLEGERGSGKTTQLANIIVNHLTDPSIKPETGLLAVAPNQMMVKLLFEKVCNMLLDRKILIQRAVHTPRMEIVIDGRKIVFSHATPNAIVTNKVDYLFIDEVDYIQKEFMDFVNVVARGAAVVIQTGAPKSVPV